MAGLGDDPSCDDLRRLVYGGEWDTIADLPAKGNFIGALEWNPAFGGGAGGLVWTDALGIYAWDAGRSGWTTRLPLEKDAWLHQFSVGLSSRGEVYSGALER